MYKMPSQLALYRNSIRGDNELFERNMSRHHIDDTWMDSLAFVGNFKSILQHHVQVYLCAIYFLHFLLSSSSPSLNRRSILAPLRGTLPCNRTNNVASS